MTFRRYVAVIFFVAVFAAIVHNFRPHSLPTGIDMDNNGIWDDVDQKIRTQLKSPLLQKGALQVAGTIQKAIVDPDNAKAIERSMAKAESCLNFLYSKIDPAKRYDQIEVRDLVVTDRDREKGWLEFNIKLSGGIYKLLPEEKANCDFDTPGL